MWLYNPLVSCVVEIVKISQENKLPFWTDIQHNIYFIFIFRTDTTKVKIEVKDRNDNKPVFKETRITKHVHYDAAINTQIVQLEVTLLAFYVVFFNFSFVSLSITETLFKHILNDIGACFIMRF